MNLFGKEIEASLCRHLRREETVKEEANRGLAALSSGPKLDLGFKEGQTITINMPVSTAGIDGD